MADQPTVYILSDSLGETAEQVTRAALSQFDSETFHVVRLPKISSRGQLEGVIRGAVCDNCVFVYTLAEPKLREMMDRIVGDLPLGAVDVLGPLVGALANAAHERPVWKVGAIRRIDSDYFERVDALDFAVQHDDGRNTEELDHAEIVLIGVSRTSKTPLAMYLAFKGYRVANVPIVPGVDPPMELFALDRRRVFGLVTEVELLIEIRRQRLHDLGPFAATYAEREAVEVELEEARALMRRIGCIVINTGGRAIEESAQEVLSYYRTGVELTDEPPPDVERIVELPPVMRRAGRHRFRREGD